MSDLPHNQKAEHAVLGSIFLEPEQCLFACNQRGITANSFHDSFARRVYTAMQTIAKRDRGVIDIVSITREMNLKDDKVLHDIIDKTPTAANVEYYLTILQDFEMRRNTIEICRKTISGMTELNRDSTGTLTTHETELMSMRINRNVKVTRLLDYREGKIEQWRGAQGKGYVGIPTQFAEVNKYLGGFRRGCMSIIGGYRGTGKSTLSRDIALWQAKQGYKVGLFSLEDPGDMASAGIVGNHAGVSVFALDTGSYRKDAVALMTTAWDELKELPIWIVDALLTIDQICSTATMLKRKNGLDVLYVDHIQKIAPYELPKMNRHGTLSLYSQSLCTLAKNLDINVCCLSQLSRDCEREARRPRLSDLRECGNIEADARQILLLFKENDPFFLEVAKNNFGVAGKTVQIYRLDGKQRFTDDVAEWRHLNEERDARNSEQSGQEEWYNA